MCGILGQIEAEAPVDPRAFEGMLQTLVSRGPDGSGIALLDDQRVALGHRRLSIIDLSDRAAQPMPNEDETVWLVFNGEVYNYRELRTRLAGAGHRFRSASDSEVIVHAYEEWGDDCVHQLRGIFAFAIWDQPRRRLLLARDPLGVKPLYVWRRSGGRLAFASQPRALLAHPDFRRELDVDALQHYLACRYVPGARAIFAGMEKLPAGHRLVAEGPRVKLERYWQVDYRPRVRDADEAAHLVREKIEESVQLQLASDVPLGLLLSGGIDSSTVGAAARRASGPGLPSFTIGFEEAGSDERPHARAAAAALACVPHEHVLTLDDAIDLIPGFTELFDEPFFDHSGLPTWAVSQLCRREGVVVALAGDGGDELFAGYRWYDSFLRLPPPLWHRRWLSRLRGQGEPDPLASYFPLVGQLDAEAQRGLLGDRDFDHLAAFRPFFRRDVPAITSLQLLDLQTFLVDDVLTKLDRASMACGVEARVPLLDRELVELAFEIDASVLYAGGERKSLLKAAVSDWLPPEILTARKKGFSVPLAAWMGQGLQELSEEIVVEGSLVSRGVFRGDGARDLLAKRHPNTTWLLLVAELWARRWLEGERATTLR